MCRGRSPGSRVAALGPGLPDAEASVTRVGPEARRSQLRGQLRLGRRSAVTEFPLSSGPPRRAEEPRRRHQARAGAARQASYKDFFISISINGGGSRKAELVSSLDVRHRGATNQQADFPKVSEGGEAAVPCTWAVAATNSRNARGCLVSYLCNRSPHGDGDGSCGNHHSRYGTSELQLSAIRRLGAFVHADRRYSWRRKRPAASWVAPSRQCT